MTTQVVERHIVRDLDAIFSPVVVSRLSKSDLDEIVSEPPTIVRQRAFLEDRISKLNTGRSILRRVMKSTMS